MRLEGDIDFTTLNWVKQELDDTLRQARQALEAYVEAPTDQSQLRFCASFLHQVQGTLRMVELYGAAMVVEEMERLVQSLLDDEIRRREDAYSVLMRGIVQMPDYLERLQGGHKDIPIVLLPLLNDLRACRGEKLLTEGVLFAPDLAAVLPAGAEGAARLLADSDLRQKSARLRTRYQAGLLAWIKNEDSEPALTELIETLDELRSLSFSPELRKLWWVAAGLLDAARQRAVDIGSAIKLLFGKVDREIKRIADGGEPQFAAAPPRELVQNLLYYLAHGAASGERVESIRETYGLQDLLPTQAELDHAKGSLGGKNRALLDTVSIAIKDDLLRVKDTLDLYLRRGDAQPAELSGQAAVLDRVADTLGMLGLGVPRRVVQEQRRVIDELASGERVASEAALLDVAGALLYVEVSLDENIRTLGVVTPDTGTETVVNIGDPSALPKAEVKRILDALLRESTVNVQRAKADVVAYIESGWESQRLTTLPTALEEIVGAMRMLDQHDTAELVRALARFVEVELVGEGRVPSGAQVEHLADAFTSIEYYMEATGESRSGREQILDVTRESLAALGYWPPPSAEELRDRDSAVPLWPFAPPAPDRPASAATAALDDAPVMMRDTLDEFAAEAEFSALELNSMPDSPPVEWDAPGALSSLESGSIAPESAEDDPYPALDQAVDLEAAIFGLPAGEAGAFEAAPVEASATSDASEAPDADVVPDAEDADQAQWQAATSDWPEVGDSVEFLTPVMGQAEGLSAGNSEDGPDDFDPSSTIDVANFPTVGFDDSLRSLDDALGRARAPASRADAQDSNGAPPDEHVEWIEIEEEFEEEIEFPLLEGEGMPGGFDASAGEDIDDDIRDVFIEEVTEEIVNIGRILPALRDNPGDIEAIRNARRSFHTLKGSGRLVGALALGEFSWHVENLLNRVLDHSIPMDAQVLDLLEHSRVALDQLRTELRGLGQASALPRLVTQAADQLVAGQPGVVETTRRVKRIRRERVATPTASDSGIEENLLAAMEIAEVEAAGVAAAGAMLASGERMPEIEPMLLEVLRSEAGGYLASLENWIDSARGSDNRLVPDAELLRSVHTLHGALGMVEVPVVAEVVGMLEGYLKRMVSGGFAPSADGLEAMGDVSGVVGATLVLLDRPGASVPRAGDLNHRLAALRDELPEASSPSLAPWSVSEEDTDDAEAPVFASESFDTTRASSAQDDATAEFAQGMPALEDVEATPTHAPGSELNLEDDPLAAELLGDVTADDQLAPPVYIEPQAVEHDFEEMHVNTTAGNGTDAEIPPVLFTADEFIESQESPALPEASEGASPDVGARETWEEQDGLPTAGGTFDAETETAAHPVDAGHVDDTAALAAEAGVEDAATNGTTNAAERRRLKRERARVDREAETIAPVEDDEQGKPAALAVDFEAEGPVTEHASEAIEIAVPAVSMAEDADSTPDTTQIPTAPVPPSTARAWQDEADPDRPLLLPDLDADLLDIFVEEGREILDQSDPVLAQLRQNVDSPAAIAALQRHLHTIKGNARAVGLMGIGDVSHSIETLIESSHGRTSASIELVQRGFDRLHRMLSRVAMGRDVAYPARLIAQLEATAAGHAFGVDGSLVEPLPDIVAAFDVDEPVSAVDEMSAHDRLALDEDVALWSDSEFVAAEEEFPVQSVEAFDGEPEFAASDAFVAAFSEEADPGVEAFPAADVDIAEMAAAAELDAVNRAREEEFAALEAARAQAGDAELDATGLATTDPAPSQTAKVVRLDDYRLPAQVTAAEDAAAQRQSQELIRVRADLLDALVNYAGEVSIYRSRLEQQLGAFRTNVGELNQTVERTREQLRKLELETETQIIARFQREAETDEGVFDPLELDRFSTLQQLSRALAESVSDLVSLHGTLDDLARQQETLLLQQSRVASELQQGLMRTRMVPFETQVPFLRRLVRQSADELGKRAQLFVDGAQGEMDRNLLERMKAPLEHMLRNALAHGIETPADRQAGGKGDEGNVRIEVAREASEVLIRVSDDGRGLDRDAIRQKAIERGLMRADSNLTDRDLFGFITETGFSTADAVSKLAGRGVGMDVVANEIRELGGSLSIDSEPGQGSKFTIRLPFTLAVTQAIMVRLGEAIFAVPMSSVQGVARLPLVDFDARATGEDTRPLNYGGEDYAVHDLAVLLGGESNRVVDSAGQLPLLLVRSGDQRAAVRVDSVVGSREIVVKSTGSQIASVPGMFGATIMGDGSVVMILDLAPLVRRHLAQRAEREVADELAYMLPGIDVGGAVGVPTRALTKRQPLIMVVDDSITMRKVTSRVLERQDMEVVTAKDGIDAVEKLQERVPDLAILDIEMPRMDGYELATYIRNDARLRHLPLVMITSRTGEKHRQRAFEIGVDRFLGKPYQEADLLRTVTELLGESDDE